MHKFWLIMLAVVLITACNYTSKETKKANFSLKKSIKLTNQLADLYVDNYFEQFPENATYHTIAIAKHDKLTDNSLESVKKWRSFEDSLLLELKKIDDRKLIGKQEWVTYGFLKETLEASIELRICRTELWQINHLSSWLLQYTQLLQSQPIGNDTLREQAIKRWSGLPYFLETEIENLKEGIKLGYTSPKRIVLLMIEQLDELLALPLEKSPFYSPALRDTNKAFQDNWKKLVETSLIPAIKNYNDFLKKEYLKQARSTISISALPGGKKSYQAFYRYFTSIKVEPDDVYDIAQFYVKLNKAKVQMIGEQLFNTSDYPVLREYIKNNPEEGFKSEQELLSYINETVKKARKKVPGYFNLLPKSELLIKPTPKVLEKLGLTYYQPATVNGEQTATFFIFFDLLPSFIFSFLNQNIHSSIALPTIF